jgi:hypothetical protein
MDMYKSAVMTLAFVLSFSAVAFGQAADTPFQVRAATHIKKRDTIDISNTGASSTQVSPQNGKVCANVYAFDTAGPMIACCTCLIPANGLVSLSLAADVLEGRRPSPKAMVLKLMASTGTTGVCNAATVGTGSNVLMTGMVAWKGDTPFTPATLSAAELQSLNTQCGFLHASPNICLACR